jgi:hypothetical protein
LTDLLAHEGYPGHHTEHALKERLYTEHGLGEHALQLINTPECLISEGLADVGVEFAVPAEEAVELRIELFERAGLAVATDRVAAREAAERMVDMIGPRRVLAEARVNAALLRHADGRDHDDVLAWLQRAGRLTPRAAAKRLEFIEHPLWRTYVFVYHEGEALLRQWLAGPRAADAGDDRRRDVRVDRYGFLIDWLIVASSIRAA